MKMAAEDDDFEAFDKVFLELCITFIRYKNEWNLHGTNSHAKGKKANANSILRRKKVEQKNPRQRLQRKMVAAKTKVEAYKKWHLRATLSSPQKPG